MSMDGKICLVTGASRGIGKGIALQLGGAHATVYITGRTLKTTEGKLGSLEETAREVEERGGRCIPVQCDHSKDEDVKRLFEQIEREQDGQLDVLVNNAYAAVKFISANLTKKFWEQPLEAWDISNNVCLRNHYICTVLAARLMVPRKKGLIVMVSSPAGIRYAFNVPYGIGKASVDRMAADCGFELRKHNVACVSLWPGAVRTENIAEVLKSPISDESSKIFPGDPKRFFELGETIEYSGKCVVGLATDPNAMKRMVEF